MEAHLQLPLCHTLIRQSHTDNSPTMAHLITWGRSTYRILKGRLGGAYTYPTLVFHCGFSHQAIRGRHAGGGGCGGGVKKVAWKIKKALQTMHTWLQRLCTITVHWQGLNYVSCITTMNWQGTICIQTTTSVSVSSAEDVNSHSQIYVHHLRGWRCMFPTNLTMNPV